MAGCIADLQAAMAAMSEDPCNRSRLYLTDRELAALPCMAHDTVFAVRAPTRLHGTYSIDALKCNTMEDRPLGYRYVALAHSVELLSEGHAVCWFPPADANMQVWAAAGVMLRPWDVGTAGVMTPTFLDNSMLQSNWVHGPVHCCRCMLRMGHRWRCPTQMQTQSWASDTGG